MVGLRRCSKGLPTATLAPKKVTVTAWWSAAFLIHYSFLNPGETITFKNKGTWTQNIRQTVIGVGARRNPSPKREGLGFVFPSVMEAAEEQTQSSPFQMACNISYLPLCFPRMTVTSSLPGRGQAANNSVGTQKTVKGPHLVLSWLLIGHIQQELRKSSSKPTSDAVSGMWGQAHASASSSAEDENSK